MAPPGRFWAAEGGVGFTNDWNPKEAPGRFISLIGLRRNKRRRSDATPCVVAGRTTVAFMSAVPLGGTTTASYSNPLREPLPSRKSSSVLPSGVGARSPQLPSFWIVEAPPGFQLDQINPPLASRPARADGCSTVPEDLRETPPARLHHGPCAHEQLGLTFIVTLARSPAVARAARQGTPPSKKTEKKKSTSPAPLEVAHHGPNRLVALTPQRLPTRHSG